MKHRAAGRQMRNRQRTLEHFLAMSNSAGSLYDAWARILDRFAREVVQPIVDNVREAFLGKVSRGDYALVPAPVEGVSAHVGPIGIDIGVPSIKPQPSTLDRQRELRARWLEQHPEDGLVAPPRIES